MNDWQQPEVTESMPFQTIGCLQRDIACCARTRRRHGVHPVTRRLTCYEWKSVRGLTGVRPIELTNDVVQRCGLSRHGKELDARFIARSGARHGAAAGDTEKFQVRVALDIDGENADVARGERFRHFEVAARAAHLADADALPSNENGPARGRAADGHQCFRPVDADDASSSSPLSVAPGTDTRSSRRHQSLPPIDTRVLDATVARNCSRPCGIDRYTSKSSSTTWWSSEKTTSRSPEKSSTMTSCMGIASPASGFSSTYRGVRRLSVM